MEGKSELERTWIYVVSQIAMLREGAMEVADKPLKADLIRRLNKLETFLALQK